MTEPSREPIDDAERVRFILFWFDINLICEIDSLDTIQAISEAITISVSAAVIHLLELYSTSTATTNKASS